jgi:hypothetical protein
MATVTQGYTWTSGETVTPTKLNSTAAPTVVVADNEVTTAKILDANVTDAKLASGIDASKITTGTLPIARIADAAVTPTKLSQPLTLATSQATTSGTNVDFTGIPSWVSRITVNVNSLSTSGSSAIIVRIGAGSFLTSGYTGSSSTTVTGGTGAIQLTSGFPISISNSLSSTLFGSLTLSRQSGNDWNASGSLGAGNEPRTYTTGGSVSLSGTLDRLRITTGNGTDTFDAGSVNIMYEG